MSDQVTNKSAVAPQSEVRVLEMALRSSTSTLQCAALQNRDFTLHIGGGLADGIRLLRQLDLHHGRPGRISRDSI